jgi:predicted ester cyclase
MPTTQCLAAAQRERYAAANAALVRRVVEDACNRDNLAVLDDMLAPLAAAEPVDQAHAGLEATANPPVQGRLRELLVAFRAAVPDARWSILEQVAQGETVVTRLSVHGTFSGPLVGLAPPGRPATLTGVVISRFAAGRLVDLWLQADLLGLLEQLGVLPPLNLAQAVTMARVLHAGALLVDGHPP